MFKENIRNSLLSVAIIMTAIFSFFNYALLAVIGVSNANAPLTFKGFSALITVWTLFEYVCNRKKCKLKKGLGVVICLIPVAIMITIFRYGFLHETLKSYFLGYFVSVIPAVLAGHLLCYKKNEMPWQFGVVVCILLSDIAMLRVLCMPDAAPYYCVYGMNYQVLSYIGTLVTMISSFVLYNYKGELNVAFTKKEKLIKMFLMLSIVLGVAAAISGQGRGAQILLVLFAIYVVVFFVGKYTHNKKNIFIVLTSGIVFIALFVIVGGDMLNSVLGDGRLGDTIRQLIENPKGYILNSIRGEIYVKVIAGIRSNPIWGHGIGAVFYVADTYSHNLFLDLLCEMGIFGIIVFLTLCCVIVKKDKEDQCTRFVCLILAFDLFVLMFSGYYLYHTGIWFALGYLFNNRLCNKKQHN